MSCSRGGVGVMGVVLGDPAVSQPLTGRIS